MFFSIFRSLHMLLSMFCPFDNLYSTLCLFDILCPMLCHSIFCQWIFCVPNRYVPFDIIRYGILNFRCLADSISFDWVFCDFDILRLLIFAASILCFRYFAFDTRRFDILLFDILPGTSRPHPQLCFWEAYISAIVHPILQMLLLQHYVVSCRISVALVFACSVWQHRLLAILYNAVIVARSL